MPFGAVLAQVGGLGRFQVLQTALLAVPILLMASHNLLQNFTAAVPPHRCRVPAVTPGPGATPSVPSVTPGPPGTTLDDTSAASDGTLRSSNAILMSPDGTLGSPGATLRSSDGNLGSPDGTRIPGVTHVPLDGTPASPDGTHVQPDATSGSSNGTLGPAGATLAWSNGTLGSPDATLGSCRRYVVSSPANGSAGPWPTEPCHDGWDYDRSIYVATIVSEWDLVCSYRQLRQMAQSIYMAGVLVGALVLGGLSDRFGRKAMLIWSYLQLGVMGTCTAFAPNYASYCVFRFAGGMALSGFGLSIACLVVEWIPTPYRAITVAITGFAYTLGQILLAGVAYTVPHWRWLQLTVSLPFFIFFLYSWWLAESARWLVLSGKAERAVKVLQRVARINRRKEEGEKITVEILRSSMKEELAGLKSSYTISDLVRTPVIRHIFFCLSIVWFSISFSYYGLAMDLQNFGVSIYLIQVIFGAVDFPAKVVVTVSLSYIGRRVSLMVALFLAGLVIIANIFVSTELQTVRTALAVIGKGCLSASFNCVFLYTTELYPTPIRQTGLGFGSTMARVGGIVAPLVKMMDEYYPFLPPAVYGVAPVVAAVAAGFLPETLNMPLPDTIEEVESRAKQKKTEDPKEKIPLQPQDKAPQKECGVGVHGCGAFLGSRSGSMAFASLLEHVGGMGRFQVASVLLLALPTLMMASHNLLQNFTAATSDHRCRLRWEANATGLDPQDLLRVSVPHGERCRRFVKPQWWLLEANGSAPNSSWPETEPCRDGWTYDRSVFTSTIVTEWDLVCSSRGLKQLAQSLYMAGVLVGGIVFGGLSDRFGRRSLLTWCYLQMGTMGTCSSFAPTFTIYCLFRFLTGMAFSGIVLNSVSLSLEWMPTRTRALVGTFMGYCYTTGQFLLAGIAYAVPDWRWLQLTVSLPFFCFFLYSWWLTESARWLVMVGKSHQALKELQKVARINGKKEEGDKLDIEALRSYMQKEMASSRSHHTVVDLVRTPVVRRISCCLCFVWFSTSFAYYGLAMDLQNFDFNIYVIQLIFGAVDIPAKLVSILTITFVGRRFTQSIALILAGLAILANILVPRDLRMLRTALAVFGKGCLAASFNCIYLYTGELYPTVIRQTGMGLANTMARLGSITAPLVKMAGDIFPALPFIIYGAAPVVSGLVAIFLPETRDVALPETVEEVEGRAQPKKDEAEHLQVPLQPTQPSDTTGAC
ncbi:uncharacterized protein RDI95_015100 [Morus bassanus]